MKIMGAVFVTLLLLPGPSSGQDRRAIAVHVGGTQSLPAPLPMIGLSLLSYDGLRAFRVGGIVGLARSERQSVDSVMPQVRQWSLDADLIFSPGNISELADAMSGFEPELFAGVGLHGSRGTNEQSSVVPVSSVGASLGKHVTQRVRADLEIRHRTALARQNEPRSIASGWEFRVGLSWHFRDSPGSGSPWRHLGGRNPYEEKPRGLDGAGRVVVHQAPRPAVPPAHRSESIGSPPRTRFGSR